MASSVRTTPLPPLADAMALDAQIGVRLPVDLLARIDRYLAQKRTTQAGSRMTRSDAFRELLEFGLRDVDYTNRQPSPAAVRRAQEAFDALPSIARAALVHTMRRIPTVTTEAPSHAALERRLNRPQRATRSTIPLRPVQTQRPVQSARPSQSRRSAPTDVHADAFAGPPPEAARQPSYVTVDHLTGTMVVVPESIPDSTTWLERVRAMGKDVTRLPPAPVPEEDVTVRPMGSTVGVGARPRTSRD